MKGKCLTNLIKLKKQEKNTVKKTNKQFDIKLC